MTSYSDLSHPKMRYVQKNQSIFDSLFGVALLRYEWIFSPAICFFNQQPVIVFDWGRSRAAKMIDEISLCNVARIQRLRGVHSIATGGVLCRPKAQHVAASLRATTRPVAPPASHTRRLAIDQRNGANSKNRAPKITRFFFLPSAPVDFRHCRWIYASLIERQS